jgi:hypothetical protein
MEEDIKRIEKFITDIKECGLNDCGKNCFDFNLLRNLLTRYKQLEEENKSKQKAYDDCYCEYKHYKQFDSIPKSKVKDKIEEYDKQRIKMEKDDIGVGFTLGKEWSDLKAKIESLQELLEENENHIPRID